MTIKPTTVKIPTGSRTHHTRGFAAFLAALSIVAALVSFTGAAPAGAADYGAPSASGFARCNATTDSYWISAGVVTNPGDYGAIRAHVHVLGQGPGTASSWTWGVTDANGVLTTTWSGSVSGASSGYQVQIQGARHTGSGWAYGDWISVNYHDHVSLLWGSTLDALTGQHYCAT